MLLQELEGRLRALRLGFVTLGRLQALDLLRENRLKHKRTAASLCVSYVEAGALLDDFLKRYYLPRNELIFWQPDVLPKTLKILQRGRVQEDMLQKVTGTLSGQLAETISTVQGSLEPGGLLSPVLPLLSSLKRRLNNDRGGEKGPLPIPPGPSGQGRGIKVLGGPEKVEMDPAFEPTYSLLKTPVPTFGETVKENVPYFWGLAIRESLAADLCALSIIEYDRMPLQFYRDMAKQAWDEMRHSTFFFDLAIKLLPDLKKCLRPSDPLRKNLTRFFESGTGLPIPKERNLYEAILNANLKERLILLHRDTETPGILRIKEKINSGFCKKHPQIAEALEVVLRDEITHSRFGHVWLEYLLPDKKIRNSEIETTELLRGVFLLASFAHYDKTGLGELMKEYAGGRTAPVSEIQNPSA